jgi:4-diphosphocytidyl-2-C-methyl-D-erythritol kinase
LTHPPGSFGKRPLHSVTVRAPAEVNLHLEVLRQRPDGFHEIESVLQAVTVFDLLQVSLLDVRGGGPPQLELTVRPAGTAPEGEENLCWQAARLFCHRLGCSGRMRIELRKEIPAGAGLGGGSSDAAAVLLACDHLFGTGLEAADLERLGAELGSDVPFFVRGGTALARGRGTELHPLPAIRRGHFLIVKPDLTISTAEVYATLRMGLTVRRAKGNMQGIKALIARFPTRAWFGFNRLEEVVLPRHPVLQRLVLRLKEEAPVAMLTGTGAAAVGVFPGEEGPSRLMNDLAQKGWYIRLAVPHPAGVELTGS